MEFFMKKFDVDSMVLVACITSAFIAIVIACLGG
jgi:hypothetical protein